MGTDLDMADIHGQAATKTYLELAAAGGHSVLMIGPPGTGKTMLARRVLGILPAPTEIEKAEINRIYDATAIAYPVRSRPFRAPHHTISAAGMFGGGPVARPGETSLAHQGILFLDELPEFRKGVLDRLLSVHTAGWNQVTSTVGYPAASMLVAAMNPCPCGGGQDCHCTVGQIAHYRERIAKIEDMIDVVVRVDPVELDMSWVAGPLSASYRARITRAWERQQERFTGTSIQHNAGIPPDLVSYFYGRAGSPALGCLGQAKRVLDLTPAGFDRVTRLALTRADLEGHDQIEVDDVEIAIEASGYGGARRPTHG